MTGGAGDAVADVFGVDVFGADVLDGVLFVAVTTDMLGPDVTETDGLFVLAGLQDDRRNMSVRIHAATRSADLPLLLLSFADIRFFIRYIV